MTSSVQSCDGSVQSQSSVCEVVKLVHEELHGLAAERERIERRIRNLQQVVNGLQKFYRQPALGDFPDQRPRSNRPDIRGRDQDAAPSVPGQSWLEATRLRRACRIALMEMTSPATVAEIHSRIVRRGAFPLANLESAHAVIVDALNAMIGGGEVRCVKGEPCMRWQRIFPVSPGGLY